MSYRPTRLPLKHIEWGRFVNLLGEAHAALGRYDFILRSLGRSRRSSRPLTLSLICQMHHKILQTAIPAKDGGKFRKRQNWIGPLGCSQKEGYFIPPKFDQVPAYMNNLKRYINSKDQDVLVQLAIFFAQLLIIHPFMDGNGRLARALIPVVLYKKKVISAPLFDMNGYFKKHRLKYFEKLFLISKRSDWEGWIRFFLQGVIEAEKKMSSILLKNRAHLSLSRRFHTLSSSSWSSFS